MTRILCSLLLLVTGLCGQSIDISSQILTGNLREVLAGKAPAEKFSRAVVSAAERYKIRASLEAASAFSTELTRALAGRQSTDAALSRVTSALVATFSYVNSAGVPPATAQSSFERLLLELGASEPDAKAVAARLQALCRP